MKPLQQPQINQPASQLPSVAKAPINPALVGQKREVVENSFSKRCNHLTKTKEGYNMIYAVFTSKLQKSQITAGFRANAELSGSDRKTLILEMMKVVSRYNWLSIADLETILDWGLSGEFDSEDQKSFSLNARTLNFWIKKYQEDIRQKAFIEQSQFLQKMEEEKEAQEKQRTYEESKKRNRQLLINCYNRIQNELEGKAYEDNFPEDMDALLLAMYFEFDKKGIFQDNSEKWQMYEEEKKLVSHMNQTIAELKVKRNCRIRIMKRHLTRLMNQKVNIEAYLNQNQL